MDKLFLRENAYTTPQFKTNLGRDRKFKDKFVTFLGRLGNSITWDELVSFNKFGLNKFGKVKILGV